MAVEFWIGRVRSGTQAGGVTMHVPSLLGAVPHGRGAFATPCAAA
jgi:hypothetical protein